MQTLFCCRFMLLFNIKLKETFPISKSLERKIHLFSNILMVSLIIVKYFTVRNLFWHKEWRFKNLILIFPPQWSANYLQIICWSICLFSADLKRHYYHELNFLTYFVVFLDCVLWFLLVSYYTPTCLSVKEENRAVFQDRDDLEEIRQLS